MTFHSPVHRSSSYRSIDRDSRVLSADPHELIVVLFAELRQSLDLMIENIHRRDDGRTFQHRARALSILGGLDEALDFEAAGDLAQTLHSIYAEASRRIQSDNGPALVEKVQSAREMLFEIEKAWKAIVLDVE